MPPHWWSTKTELHSSRRWACCFPCQNLISREICSFRLKRLRERYHSIQQREVQTPNVNLTLDCYSSVGFPFVWNRTNETLRCQLYIIRCESKLCQSFVGSIQTLDGKREKIRHLIWREVKERYFEANRVRSWKHQTVCRYDQSTDQSQFHGFWRISVIIEAVSPLLL